jgi:uncharacterized membrane protein
MDPTFSIGNVLGTGFRIWIKNFIPFMIITTLIYAPLLIWGVSAVQGEMDYAHLKRISDVAKYSPMLIPLLNIFVSAALTYGVVMTLQGQRASIGACIGTGLVRFFPVLGVAIVSGLCIIGGFIALVIPGIIVFCMLYVATQVSVLERPGVMGALRRSRELTTGHRFEIFGLLFILFLITFGLTKIIEAVMLPHAGDPSHYEETLRRIPAYMYVDLARALVVGSIGSVMAAVTYYFLRMEKEGTSATELAQIFE